MRWSRMFIPTLRENPADVDFPAQQLLMRAGFVRSPAADLIWWLPLGQRTVMKLARLVRVQMNGAGAQEFVTLGLQAFTEIARNELRSYRGLPQIWYRMTAGSPFPTEDSVSFDTDHETQDRSYRLHRDLFQHVFQRCGLSFGVVEAGSRREEFVVRAGAGDRQLVSCTCGYAAYQAHAASRIEKPIDDECSGPPVEVHTPGQKTIADICDYLKVSASQQIKSLVYIVDDKPFLFLVLGHHQLSEAKMIEATGAASARPAEPEEIRAAFGADAGSLGPVGVTNLPVCADLELQGRRNLTCGANRNDYHLQRVTPDVDFKPIWADLRTVEPGESCIRCGRPLEVCRAFEIGYLEKLRPHDSAPTVLSGEGKQLQVAEGNYGLDLYRILLSCVTLHHDDDGISWPVAIAPFAVVLTAINYREAVKTAADRIYADICAAGIDVLLDDRQERAGVKFKDADLIGIPFRVVIGEKVKQGQVELFDRATKEKQVLEIDAVVPTLRAKL